MELLGWDFVANFHIDEAIRYCCREFGAAAGIRTRVVGLEGQWTRKRNVLDQARLRPHAHQEQPVFANKC